MKPTSHLPLLVSNLLCAIAVFAREHSARHKESCRYQRNEFSHNRNLDVPDEIVVQKFEAA